MNELVALIDWSQVPAIITVIGMLLTRAWKSREQLALRERVSDLEEQCFEEVRAHNATKRQKLLLRDELQEYKSEQPSHEEAPEEAETGNDTEDTESS